MKFAALIIAIILLIIVGIACIPFFTGLFSEDSRQQVVADVRAKGPLGVLLIIGLEIMQVIVAFIPGEVVQMISGILFGTIGGALVLLVGILIAGCIVYKVVERLGMPFVRSVISDEMVEKLDFLNDNKRIDIIVFILFFIPGLPKDVFTYFVPLTEMPLSRFLLLSTIARTPALIASTYAGAAFTSGNYTGMIVMFIICGGLGVVGIVFRDRIFDWFRDKKEAVRARLGAPTIEPISAASEGRSRAAGRALPARASDRGQVSGDDVSDADLATDPDGAGWKDSEKMDAEEGHAGSVQAYSEPAMHADPRPVAADTDGEQTRTRPRGAAAGGARRAQDPAAHAHGTHSDAHARSAGEHRRPGTQTSDTAGHRTRDRGERPIQARFRERTRSNDPHRIPRATYTGGSPKHRVATDTAKRAARKTGSAVSSGARRLWGGISDKAATARARRPSRRGEGSAGRYDGDDPRSSSRGRSRDDGSQGRSRGGRDRRD